jgi:hypothetical protein
MYGIILPIDELIFFRGVGSTTNQICYVGSKSGCFNVGMHMMTITKVPERSKWMLLFTTESASSGSRESPNICHRYGVSQNFNPRNGAIFIKHHFNIASLR